MADECLIAVATTDEIVVNSHFGRATHFQIVKMNMNCFAYEVIGSIDVEPVCHGGNHDEEELRKRIDEYRKYQYILVSRVGETARNEIEKCGIEIYEIPGLIEESLYSLFTHLKIQNLFMDYL